MERYIRMHNEQAIAFERGSRLGIRFAVSAFLSGLPSSIYDDIFERTVNYLCEEHREEMNREDNNV